MKVVLVVVGCALTLMGIGGFLLVIATELDDGLPYTSIGLVLIGLVMFTIGLRPTTPERVSRRRVKRQK